MKKWFLSFALVAMFSGLSFGQLIDEKNVTVTMDLQPVLQLYMTTPDQVEFIFDDIKDYYSGITKYAATILKVSSSVSWDLYVVGTSQTGGGLLWDQQLSYSTGGGSGIANIPLCALELRQYEANRYEAAATGLPDYSLAFADPDALVIGQNSIFESATPYTTPGVGDKYIQGHFGVGVANSAPGGSYLTATPILLQNFTDYYFTIDYRILPSLPATFPAAGTNAGVTHALAAGTYANPGVYTMNVKYILLEDQ